MDLLLHVDTDLTPTCAGDAVEVFNGINGNSPMLMRVCGHNVQRSLTSSTSNVAVRFKSDLYRRAVRSGLYFTYSLGVPTGKVHDCVLVIQMGSFLSNEHCTGSNKLGHFCHIGLHQLKLISFS